MDIRYTVLRNLDFSGKYAMIAGTFAGYRPHYGDAARFMQSGYLHDLLRN